MAIHPTAIIDDGANVADATIGPYCHIGAGVTLGEGVRVESHAVITGPTDIGPGTHIFPFAALGGPPQHVACNGEGARLVIGANNIIRENVTMHRGTVAGGGETRIGDDGYFMVNSHIAHDCKVGDKVILANGAEVGGHVRIGDHAFLGGLCAIHQFSRIGDHAFVGGGAIVTSDVIPYASVIGNQARLVGLNVIGLKRRGFEKDAIRDLRAAYKSLFSDFGVFRDRIEGVRAEFGHRVEVKHLLEFIEADAPRPLMTAAHAP